MQPVSAVAIFCEDIREEQSGQNTIVGTLPDNLVVQAPPTGTPSTASAVMGKLAVYLRINFDIDDKPQEVTIKLLNTNGTLLTEGGWDRSVMDKAFADSKAN